MNSRRPAVSDELDALRWLHLGHLLLEKPDLVSVRIRDREGTIAHHWVVRGLVIFDAALLDLVMMGLRDERSALVALMSLGVSDAATLCREGDMASSKIYRAMEKTR